MNENKRLFVQLRHQDHSNTRFLALGRAAAVAEATGLPPVNDGAPIPPLPRERAFEGLRQQKSRSLRLGDVLPRYYFLRQVQREKRRTDRTGAPLSIALFHFDSHKSDDPGNIRTLLELLRDSKRETDIIGSLGGDTIAMLLPDTNREGAQVLAERIVGQCSNPPFSAITVTYPDQLFESLIEENQELPDFAPLFRDDSPDETRREYFLKRGLDILGAIIALLLFSPVMLITAIAVAVSSPGPVIFKQVRLGKRGIPFVFYKFRSMFGDADDRIHRDYVTNLIKGNLDQINQGSAAKPYYKIKSDPRVTRVGKFIRSTNIDELPQLLNVLKGEMSLVGPRPPLPYEVEKYESWHLRRLLEVRPGITGLWQVDGHNTTTFDDMVRIDLRYIRDCSLFLDLSILFSTVKLVLVRLFA